MLFGIHIDYPARCDAARKFPTSNEDAMLVRPWRHPMDHFNAPRATAGYNRNSFHLAGREEPLRGGPDEEQDTGEGGVWDVYADFNNAGPRYSTAFGIGQPQTQAGSVYIYSLVVSMSYLAQL